MPEEKDSFANRGVVEDDQNTPTSMQGQLSHRTDNPLAKSSDSDYPEPGENPEHSGEPETDGITRDYKKPA